MYFSGKITNSIIQYLTHIGIPTEGIYSLTETSEELLKDPTSWITASQAETFLSIVEENYRTHFPGESFIEKAGHSCVELRAWGALDSVLRMMKHPQDIYNQPQRFLSYFISPAPPIGNLNRRVDYVQFELPITKVEYSLTTAYLRAVLEALPNFMDHPMARVDWFETKILINWSQQQKSLFTEEMKEQNLKPELFTSLVNNFETLQKEVEDKKQEIQKKEIENQQLRVIIESSTSEKAVSNRDKTESMRLALELSKSIEKPLQQIQDQILRLNDYMGRAQQLVTLLIAQDRLNPQVQEAMRRVDWEFIKTEFPMVASQGVESLKKIKLVGSDFNWEVEQNKVEVERTSINLNQVIERAIDRITGKRDRLEIDRILFFDHDVAMAPEQMESAFYEIFNNSALTMTGEGKIQVITRPRGKRAEIEISDTGSGISASDYNHNKSWLKVKQIIKQHRGHIRYRSFKGEGSTFLIDIPVQ